MTIYDVSERAGVSIATISRVINGSGKVSEATKGRVLRVIDEIGYTPNAFARGLNINSMKTVGILCSDSSDPYLAHAIYHIERALRKNNYGSLLCCTGFDIDAKKSSLSLLMSKRVDAIILVGSNYVESDNKNNHYIREAAKKIPIMIVNGILDSDNIYSTVCDDKDAIFQITDRMIKNGRSNLIYIYNSMSYSGMKKLSGFKEAFGANGLTYNGEHALYVPLGHKSIENTKKHLEDAAQKGIVFDGIVTSDDILAIGAMKYAKRKGMNIPHDIFVSGFNNSNLSECCDPELTSIDNNIESLCNHSVATLMGVFGGCDMPKTSVYSPKIIERETTAFLV